jgi:hypothetical protein
MQMSGSNEFETISVKITAETRDQIAFIANAEGKTFDEVAAKFLHDEAEAQASLARGPLLRKHMYR